MSDDKRQKEEEAFIKKLEKELEQQLREMEDLKKRGQENLIRKIRESVLKQLTLKGKLQCEDKIVSSRKHSTGLHHEDHLSVPSSFEHSVPKKPTYSKGCKSSFQNSISRQSSPKSRNGYQCHTTGKASPTSFKDLEKWAESVSLDPATVSVLKEEGFTNLQLLRHLTPEHVTEELQKTKRLSLAQSLALKAAIGKLENQSSASAVDERSERHGTRQELDETCLPVKMATEDFDKEGKIGSGKITTGNTILGEELFDTKVSFESVTDVCHWKLSHNHGVTIEITDSPGLFDTSKDHETIASEVAKVVAGMTTGPHAILYVIKIGRLTKEQEGVCNRLLALFDEDLASNTFIVFTGGDSIKPGQTIENLLVNTPESMKRVLHACHYRYVVFNSKAPNKQPQVDLLNKVRALAAKNSGAPYTSPKVYQIGEEMEKEVTKRMVMKEEEEMRRAQVESLKQHLEQKQISEEKTQQEKEAFLKKLEERRQQMRDAKEKRKREQDIIKKKEEEIKKMMEKIMDEERNIREKWARAHEEERRKLKVQILQGKETSYMKQIELFIQAYEVILQVTSKV